MKVNEILEFISSNYFILSEHKKNKEARNSDKQLFNDGFFTRHLFTDH
jgi:hypothetical protein